MKLKCKDCRYWSEMLAKTAHGIVVAMCLCDQSPNVEVYTAPHSGCGHGEEGEAIDAPGGTGR